MARVLATPAEGMRVRKPDGVPLKPEGEPVERDSFWLRRERDGDVKLSEIAEEVPADVSSKRKGA